MRKFSSALGRKPDNLYESICEPVRSQSEMYEKHATPYTLYVNHSKTTLYIKKQ